MLRSITAALVVVSQFCVAQAAPKASVEIRVLPERPLIEHRGSQRMLNFDLLGSKSVNVERGQIDSGDIVEPASR